LAVLPPKLPTGSESRGEAIDLRIWEPRANCRMVCGGRSTGGLVMN